MVKPSDAGWASMSDDEFREISEASWKAVPRGFKILIKTPEMKQIENWYKRLSEIGWLALQPANWWYGPNSESTDDLYG